MRSAPFSFHLVAGRSGAQIRAGSEIARVVGDCGMSLSPKATRLLLAAGVTEAQFAVVTP